MSARSPALAIVKPARDTGRTVTYVQPLELEGVNVEVVLTINVIELLEELGAKAARSLGGRAIDARGAVVATVRPEDQARVRTAIVEKRKARMAL